VKINSWVLNLNKGQQIVAPAGYNRTTIKDFACSISQAERFSRAYHTLITYKFFNNLF
jgi:hypothetical protein